MRFSGDPGDRKNKIDIFSDPFMGRKKSIEDWRGAQSKIGHPSSIFVLLISSKIFLFQKLNGRAKNFGNRGLKKINNQGPRLTIGDRRIIFFCCDSLHQPQVFLRHNKKFQNVLFYTSLLSPHAFFHVSNNEFPKSNY